MSTHLRPSGFAELGDMVWGTHFCLFYQTKEDLLDFLLPFFKAGLEHNEFCLCVASEPLIAEEVERAMREAFPDFDHYLAGGQLEITSHTDWYLKDGHFDEQRVLQGWIDKLDQALARGFSGVRFAANILLEQADWESFVRYEGKLEEALHGLRIEGTCAYDLNRYSAANVLDIVGHHQFTLARRNGAWESLEGTRLKQAHNEILKLNTHLEQHVRDRTFELTSTNERLSAEIVERKRVEEALRESEEKFSAAFRASPIALVIATLDGKFVEMNQAYCDLLGYSREELLGKTGIELGVFTEEARQEWVETAERNRGVITNRELSFRVRNGISRTVLSSVEKITFHGIPHFLSTILDITERKKTEEALRRSETNFRMLADKSPQGIGIFQDQKIVYANQAQSDILGYTIEELKAMSVEQIIALTHPLDLPISVERVRKRIAGEELSQFIELRILRKDGSSRWIQAFNNLIEYNGRPAILTASIDISERKRAEEAIRNSERVLREAESLGHTGSWEQNLVTGEIFNTEENLRLFFSDDRSKGADFEDYSQVIHPDDREYVLRRRAEFLEEEGPGDIEYRVVWPDGSVHVIFGRATVVRGELGQPVRVYGTNVDITERKRAEEELKKQAARAETLARIAARLNKQLDLDAVIDAICQEAVDTFKVSQATMSLYDAKRDLLDYAGGVNIPPKYAAKFEPVSRVQFDQLVRTMGPILVVPDIQALPNVPNAEFSAQLDVRTVVTADLRRDQELIGVLALGVNGQVREFDQDELSLLKAISDQAAQAIANAQLLRTANDQRQQLRDLSAKLREVQEAEQRALTAELHDRVGQNLTGLSINLQNMKALLPNDAAKILATKFDDAQALVEHTTRQIRDIMAELHPPELEDYGLAVALETYAERAASRGNLELIADLPDLALPSLPSDVRIALFRAAQEAISNVLKHASARQLEVSLQERDGRIHLKVEDDGQGFDPDSVSQKETQTWGLKIMRERIESIGGKVQIESEPGEGTRVTFEIERQT